MTMVFHQLRTRLRRHFIPVTGLVILAALSSAKVQSAELDIVTDIAPVHSLVSMVLGESSKVSLLIPASTSPHTFNLKPSQRSALEKAQLVVILSSDFTPSLGRHLQSSNKTDNVLMLLSVDHDHGGKTQPEPSVSDQTQSNASIHYGAETDPHAWLDPLNAIDWLDKIAAAMVKIDKKNAANYIDNAQLAKQQLSSLHQSINQELIPVRAESYIVYHDAYRHFAKSYSLQAPISIALSDARSPGAGTLRKVREQATSATCAFSELQHETSIVDTVIERLSIKRGILDPMGSSLEMGKTLYPTLMRSLAKSFLDCLS